MDQNFDQKPYAPARLRALMTILLLGAGAACDALSLALNVALGGMLPEAGDGSAPYEFGGSATELFYVGVALLQLVVFIATVVAFLLWMHRAYRNLPALGATGLDTTPGWAVCYFFIPFANLIKPFQVVREIWHESIPGGEAQGDFGGVSTRAGTPALVGWWWAFWIVANIVGRVSDRATEMTGTIDGMLLASRLVIASNALFIVAALLAILVVKRIDEMQEAKFGQMVAQGPPPPPDSFESPRIA